MVGGKGAIKVAKNLFKELRKHRKIRLRPKWCSKKEKENYFSYSLKLSQVPLSLNSPKQCPLPQLISVYPVLENHQRSS